MSRKNALPLWQSSSITATNLSSSFLLLLATSTLFFLAILLIDPTNSLLVLARPSSSLNSHRNREITVEEQQQLVELTEESGSSEAADGIRYGLTEETTNEEGRKTTSERTLSRDTFFSLDPEPNNNNDDQIRQRTSQNSRALRGQRKRHRNRNRGEQQQEGVEGQIGADGNKKEEAEDDRLVGLVDGQSLLSLTSVDIVNTTLQANTCRGDLFKHKVRVAGCRPKTITNRFCHGSCSSFYIPRLRSKKLKATFQSCAACVPSETDLVQVRLDCPNREEGHIYRTIVRVKKCACRNIVLEGEENDDEETSTAAVATITDDDGMNGGGEDSGNDGPSFASED